MHLQDLRAALADDHGVCVRKDGGNGEAARALDVHEERAGGGHEGLELVLLGLTGAAISQTYRGGCGRRAYAAGEGLRRSTART